MQLIQVGKILKPFGVDGHLKFKVEKHYEEDFGRADVIFLKGGDGDIPYFVESVTQLGVITIKLEDIDSKEAASKLSLHTISLRKEDVQALTKEEAPSMNMLKGFKLSDGNKTLGEILEVLEFPQQTMAKVETTDGTVLIPLIEEFIVDLDTENMNIHCELPEGLVESQL